MLKSKGPSEGERGMLSRSLRCEAKEEKDSSCPPVHGDFETDFQRASWDSSFPSKVHEIISAFQCQEFYTNLERWVQLEIEMLPPIYVLSTCHRVLEEVHFHSSSHLMIVLEATWKIKDLTSWSKQSNDGMEGWSCAHLENLIFYPLNIFKGCWSVPFQVNLLHVECSPGAQCVCKLYIFHYRQRTPPTGTNEFLFLLPKCTVKDLTLLCIE